MDLWCAHRGLSGSDLLMGYRDVAPSRCFSGLTQQLLEEAMSPWDMKRNACVTPDSGGNRTQSSMTDLSQLNK